jgi:hypothetical protein
MSPDRMNKALDRFRKLWRLALTFGMVAVITPVAGMGVTWFLVRGKLDAMGTSTIKDPGSVAEPVGQVLIPALIGLGLAFVALVLCVTCIIRALRERRKLLGRQAR